ncbi:cation channel sperm-associated protein subunit delta-like [Peromyscus leucopus]|uniref:cation channel sperm-associated protein subunit delta-like n=1 Tax=Peromyscus leucopus TaxID=10041 RepID=UPI001885345A|nr:cation channel sperm-associated protein subunit delta-like [Peromyscus leucopus]
MPRLGGGERSAVAYLSFNAHAQTPPQAPWQLRSGVSCGRPGEMLLLMLAAVATVVRAQPLCRSYRVRTGKVFASKPLPEGDMLFYAFNSTFVLRDFCHSKAVLYLGKKIFISKDNFESSLPPLIIPKSMRARGASVTSALFTSDSKLLLVVNKKVYMYNYLWNRWHKAIGIFQPVSHISGDKCCFKNEFCLVSWNLS